MLSLLVVMEMQMNATTRIYLTFTNVANIKKTDHTMCPAFLGKMQNGTSTLKRSSAVQYSIK